MSQFDVQAAYVDRLRPFAKCSDVEWQIMLTEVKSVGLSGISKSATHLLMITKDAADRAGVLKHPGHADQSVHGNGGKNSRAGAASLAGRASGEGSRTSVGVMDADGRPALVNATSTPVLGANLQVGDMIDGIGGTTEIVGFGVGGPFGNSKTMTTRPVHMNASSTKGTGRGETRTDSVSLDHNYRVITDFAPFGVEKAGDPVVKHPGHADQSVHGNGGKNSRSGSAGGSAGGGEGAAANKELDQADLAVSELKSEIRGLVVAGDSLGEYGAVRSMEREIVSATDHLGNARSVNNRTAADGFTRGHNKGVRNDYADKALADLQGIEDSLMSVVRGTGRLPQQASTMSSVARSRALIDMARTALNGVKGAP